MLYYWHKNVYNTTLIKISSSQQNDYLEMIIIIFGAMLHKVSTSKFFLANNIQIFQVLVKYGNSKLK